MVSIVSVPLAEWSWVQILVGAKDFSFLQNIPDQLWVPLSLLYKGTGVLSRD